MSLHRNELKEYLSKQLEFYFPDKYKFKGKDIDCAFELALDRLENCFKYISFPAYSNEFGQTYFSHLHADQYASFLYFMANTLWEEYENKALCDKIIYLNRTLNNFYCSYKGKLPDIFFLGHPMGTILGNASYSNYLVVFQNVTVNTSTKEDGSIAPVLGEGVFLGTGAKIIGNEAIGNRVSIGVDAVVYKQKIPDDMVVIREKQRSLVKKREKECCMAQNYFRVKI